MNRQQLRVLIIDDNPDDSALLVGLIESLSYWNAECMVCTAGGDALSLVKLSGSKPDLIFLNYTLRDGVGTDMVRAMKDAGCRAGYILFSNVVGEDALLDTLRSGADDFLKKTELNQETLSRSIYHTMAKVRSTRALDHALHLQREAKEELERRVRERTAQLATVNEQLNIVTEGANDAIIMLDPDGRVMFWNHAAERIFGWTPADVTGRDMHLLLAPAEYHAAFKTGFAAFRTSGHGPLVGKATEVNALRSDGSIFPVEVSISAISINGEWYSVGILRDITERKEAEAKLRASQERFQTLVDSLDALVYVADIKTYEILFINKYGRDHFGDVVGFPCWNRLQLDQVGPCKFCTNDKLLTPEGEPSGVFDWETRNTKTGRWYTVRDRALRWVDGRMVRLEIAADITRIKEAEANHLRAREAAEEATRLKDKFVSLVAHDLRSPFTTIMGFLNLLDGDPESRLNKKQRKIMRLVMESSHKLLRMIDEILDISRFKTGKITLNPRFVGAAFLAEKAIEQFLPLAKRKGVGLKSELPRDMRIFADPELYGEVLNNLISNSIKFCRPGGQVVICQPVGEPTTVAVKDNGVGVSQRLLPKLFRLEEKTSTVGTAGEQGTGFGLPFSLELIQAHGGDIRVESQEGVGSTFFVRLPVKIPKILLVDDDDEFRALLKIHLEQFEVEIFMASDALEGATMLEHVVYNLIICDVNLPGTSGIEFMEQVRSHPKNQVVPVIIITADEAIRTRDLAFELGANDFVTKPIELHDFVPRVRRFIH